MGEAGGPQASRGVHKNCSFPPLFTPWTALRALDGGGCRVPARGALGWQFQASPRAGCSLSSLLSQSEPWKPFSAAVASPSDFCSFSVASLVAWG